MTQNARPDLNTGALAKAFERLDEHHADIAGIKSNIASIDGKVGQVENRLGQIGSDVRDLTSAITKFSASERPSLMYYLGGLVALLTIVGGLSLGISSYVGYIYDARITQIAGDASWARNELADRNRRMADELARLRQEKEAAIAARISALEAQAGWAPQTTRAP